jgi:hypothetical protein
MLGNVFRIVIFRNLLTICNNGKGIEPLMTAKTEIERLKVPFNYLREVEPKFLCRILTCRNRLFPTIIRLSTERFARLVV